MKKKLLTLIIALVCVFSFNVFAESSAKLIVQSGDGTKLGDEVCLGDQCFYVIENNGEQATLLSKYNLYNGWVYNVEIVDQETTNYNERNDKCYRPFYGNGCMNDLYEKTGLSSDEAYGWNYEEFSDTDGVHFKVFYFTYLAADEFKQSSEAIGAHGDSKGQPEFPEVAVFNIENSNFNFDIIYNLEGGNTSDFVKDGDRYSTYFQDFNFKKDIYYYDVNDYRVLKGYKNYLGDKGLDIKDINILSLTDLNNIVKSATGSELPLDDWAEDREWFDGSSGHNSYFVYGSLKDALNDNHSWLWGTTYWLRTYDYRTNYAPTFLFVDTLGEVCSDGNCSGVVGAGVRPVIVVDSKDIYKERPPVVNPETGGIALVVIVGVCGLLFGAVKTKKKLS